VALLRGRRRTQDDMPARQSLTGSDAVAAQTMLELLPTAAVLLDRDDNVVLANPAAHSLRLIRGDALDVRELHGLVWQTRREGASQERELCLDVDVYPRRSVNVSVRTTPMDDGGVALVVDDITEAKRLEAVRRDFVANVGHEIKTPVGALSVLADAAADARDDPEAVGRFIRRIQHEAERLSTLVQELLDLSRLQGGDPLPDSTTVSLDDVVREAVDRVGPVAEAKQIEVVVATDLDVSTAGSEAQLVTAVGNLLDNAIAYSAEGTRVAVSVQERDGMSEITVTDQGIGIAAADQQRIFERFYRVDAARSRATGGTGLGLAIVKHIVSNHGGDIAVWSQPGSGSTFTIRLPLVVPAEQATP
jgi:two-component system sensor histidine kinase SenX3